MKLTARDLQGLYKSARVSLVAWTLTIWGGDAYWLILVVFGIVENVRQEVLGGNVQFLGRFEDHFDIQYAN